MELSTSTLGLLLALAIALSIGALVVGVLAIQGQRRVRAAYGRFSRGSRDDVITLIDRHIEEVAQLREEVRRQQAYADQLRALIGRAISKVGTVRYDAFDDMGGRLSFSLALLDEHGDGSVVSAMNGREQTRTYAKPVTGGTSPHNLSAEELEAITLALAGREQPRPAPTPAAARRQPRPLFSSRPKRPTPRHARPGPGAAETPAPAEQEVQGGVASTST